MLDLSKLAPHPAQFKTGTGSSVLAAVWRRICLLGMSCLWSDIVETRVPAGTASCYG